jgi:hypothetical protein
MAAAKKDDKPAAEVVLVPFAYAKATSGEVVQLRKGDVIVSGRFAEESLDHLRGIGFIGKSK